MAEKAAAVGKYKEDARDNRLKLNTNLEEVRRARGRGQRTPAGAADCPPSRPQQTPRPARRATVPRARPARRR